ncbi:MAG: hypothetical protein RI531_09210 [Haloferacaceae archaeon]|nr:hypothetical protein [Haloferacaceae archaeon]
MTANFRDDFIDRFHQDIERIDSGDLTGYAMGECLYLQDETNMDAWIEGKAVNLGDHQ